MVETYLITAPQHQPIKLINCTVFINSTVNSLNAIDCRITNKGDIRMLMQNKDADRYLEEMHEIYSQLVSRPIENKLLKMQERIEMLQDRCRSYVERIDSLEKEIQRKEEREAYEPRRSDIKMISDNLDLFLGEDWTGEDGRIPWTRNRETFAEWSERERKRRINARIEEEGIDCMMDKDKDKPKGKR